MSWAFCDSGYVKTRKEHKCVHCGRAIPSKSRVINWHGMWEGEFVNSYACHSCDEHRDYLVDDHDNTIVDFGDGVHYLIEDMIYELRKTHDDLEWELEGDYIVFRDADDVFIDKYYYPVIIKEENK